MAKQLLAGGFHSSRLKMAALAAAESGRQCPRLRKVAAHKEDDPALPHHERADRLGNQGADEAAKLGALLHDVGSEQARRQAAHEWACRVAMGRVIGATLAHWPSARKANGGRAARLAPPPGDRMPKEKRPIVKEHVFTCMAGKWVCENCFATAISKRRASLRTRSEECGGTPAALAQAMSLAPELGHTLQLLVADGQTTVICTKCGRHTSQRNRKLCDPCPSKPVSSQVKSRLGRLNRGLHPDPKVCRKIESRFDIRDKVLTTLPS